MARLPCKLLCRLPASVSIASQVEVRCTETGETAAFYYNDWLSQDDPPYKTSVELLPEGAGGPGSSGSASGLVRCGASGRRLDRLTHHHHTPNLARLIMQDR